MTERASETDRAEKPEGCTQPCRWFATGAPVMSAHGETVRVLSTGDLNALERMLDEAEARGRAEEREACAAQPGDPTVRHVVAWMRATYPQNQHAREWADEIDYVFLRRGNPRAMACGWCVSGADCPRHPSDEEGPRTAEAIHYGCPDCASAGLPAHDRTAEEATRTCQYLCERDKRRTDKAKPYDATAPERVELWDAIHAYARASYTGKERGPSGDRMTAVSRVTRAVEDGMFDLLRRERGDRRESAPTVDYRALLDALVKALDGTFSVDAGPAALKVAWVNASTALGRFDPSDSSGEGRGGGESR